EHSFSPHHHAPRTMRDMCERYSRPRGVTAAPTNSPRHCRRGAARGTGGPGFSEGWRMWMTRGLVLAVWGVLATTSCASTGAYVPVDEYTEPAEAKPLGYVIQPGDVVQIRVFNQPDMSARARVRDDGKISVPFLNDVVVAGLTPNALAQQLQVRLKDFINAPVVTVSLEETRPFSVSVIGEVVKAGVYAIPSNSGVLQALAAAGGF